MKKNILIISSEFPPQPGGIGNHAYNLAFYLSKNNYTVSVIADQRAIVNAEENAFDSKLSFTVQRIPLKRVRFLMYVHRVIKTMRAFKKADYVIATGKFSLWNVAFCSFFFTRKTMAVIHGTEVNFQSAGLKRAIDMSLKRFDLIVAVSEYTKRLVAHIEREVIVIPNGINLSAWQAKNSNKASLNGQPVLTTVGRVSTRKGQLQVIKLLPELTMLYPNIHYHCIGIPTEANDFMHQARALGVDTKVTFHGAVDDIRLKAVLLASDVFVMLSTESNTGDVEGFGIAILEANALGIPAIGSNNCGIEDAILDEKSGLLVSNGDIAEFKSALKSIMEHPDQYKAGAIKWANRHSWDDIVARYIKEIESHI